MNESEYNSYRNQLEELIHNLHLGIQVEDLLEENLVWENIPHDQEYITILEAKTKEVYDTLWNDPLNGIQRYFPHKFEQFDKSSKYWWMSLVNRAQIIKPLKE